MIGGDPPPSWVTGGATKPMLPSLWTVTSPVRISGSPALRGPHIAFAYTPSNIGGVVLITLRGLVLLER